MKPKISVIVFTCRPGGIDVLLCGLKHQEFKEFEVILVDALYDHRNEIVADMFSQARIPLIHTPPHRWLFPYDSIPPAVNTGIAKAHGELLVFFVDYTYLPPACLKEHWGVWEYFDKKRAGMGAHRYLYPPETAFPLPTYAPSIGGTSGGPLVTYQYDERQSRDYVEDIQSGVYDAYMYSIFKQPIERPDLIASLSDDPEFFNKDPKLGGLVSAKITGNFLHLKNDGVALNWLLQVNGLDEGYTGHLYCDVDLGWRLETVGAEWLLLHEVGWVYIVNPRHIFPHILWQVEPEVHREKYEIVRADPDTHRYAKNAFDLSHVRATGLNWYS